MWLRILTIVVGTLLLAPNAQARTYAAIVQDYQTGEVLHSRSADTLIYPASLTKMMTLYMLFEALDDGRYSLDSKLSVSARAAGMPASRLGLKRGETIKVRDAIKALIVKSANDVAVVVAEALSKTEIQFALAMTERARELGMNKTTFKNASGLPNSRQRTTARDMVKLATKLIQDHQGRYASFALSKFTFRGKTYRSHNNVVMQYPGADGLKTGYIRASGFNVASSAVRQGRRIVAIVIGGRKAQTRDAEMVRLLDLGFSRLKDREPLIAVAPPKPRPDRKNVNIEVAASTGLPVIVPVMRETAAEARAVKIVEPAPRPVEPGLIIADKTTAEELPVVHAPRRSTMVVAADQAAQNSLLGLATGPQKAAAKGRYGVQVGAYHDAEKARAHAHRVARKLPDILLQGDIDISGLNRGRRTVYRARVIGFSKDMAEQACTNLRQLHQECLVIRTDQLQLAAN